MSILMISNIVLWMTTLALGALVFALARQIGVLHERIAPIGALALEQGPKVGDPAPLLDLVALDGAIVQLGRLRDRDLLLFFLSPTCPVCKKLLPVLRALRSSEASTMDIVLASDGDAAEHRRFVRAHRLEGFTYLISAELGLGFKIGKLPYAVLLDNNSRIRAKGLVNSREQIESLLVARQLGVASIQEFRARQKLIGKAENT